MVKNVSGVDLLNPSQRLEICGDQMYYYDMVSDLLSFAVQSAKFINAVQSIQRQLLTCTYYFSMTAPSSLR